MEYYKDKTQFIAGEVWLKVGDKHGKYEVSNLGRLRTIKGRMPGIRCQRISHKGYPIAKIDYKTKFVHRIIALAFIPNPLNLPQVNHKNGVKTDNRIENLEWCDNLHNMRHAHANGLRPQLPYGQNHHKAILDDTAMKAVLRLSLTSTLTLKQLAEMSGLKFWQVDKLKLGKTWAHIQPYRNYFE